MSPQPSRATASLPPKQLLPHHPQTGASAPCLSVIGRPQQYETTGISSVFAKHLPTAQSLLSLQGQVSHCLFNLTTKFCQNHHPAVNNEGTLQPPFLKGNGDKQPEVQQFAVSLWDRAGLSLGQGGEGARGLHYLPHCSLLLIPRTLSSALLTENFLLRPSSLPLHLKPLSACLVGLSCEPGGGGLCSVARSHEGSVLPSQCF